MSTEIIEKEDKRDISTRAIDKEKANRYEDNKAKKELKQRKMIALVKNLTKEN